MIILVGLAIANCRHLRLMNRLQLVFLNSHEKTCLVISRYLPQLLELFFGWLLLATRLLSLVTLAFVFGTLAAAFDILEINCFYLLNWLLLQNAYIL